MKKNIFYALFFLILFSCSSVTSKQKFENGDYLGSLEQIGRELNRRNKNVNQEYQKIIQNRVMDIDKIMKERLNNSFDELNISNVNYELWKMGHIIQKYPLISKYTPIMINVEKNKEYLKKSLDVMLQYVSKDYEKRVFKLEELLNFIKKEVVFNNEYQEIHKEYSKIASDIYYKIAEDNLKKNNLKESKENYYKSYNIYKFYDKNYKNTYTKYFKLIREIELKEALDYERIAKNEFHKALYENSRENFKKAIDIYKKYNLDRDLERNTIYLEKISEKVSEIEFYNNYKIVEELLKEADKYKEKRDLVYEKRTLYKALDQLSITLFFASNENLKKIVNDKIDGIKKRIEY